MTRPHPGLVPGLRPPTEAEYLAGLLRARRREVRLMALPRPPITLRRFSWEERP